MKTSKHFKVTMEQQDWPSFRIISNDIIKIEEISIDSHPEIKPNNDSGHASNFLDDSTIECMSDELKRATNAITTILTIVEKIHNKIG